MFSFNRLSKLRVVVVTFVLLHYSLWALYFVVQGRAIEMAIARHELPHQMIYALIGFVCVKMLVMLCDVFQTFIIKYDMNNEIQSLWNQYAPQAIYRENLSQKTDVILLFFDYLPRIFDTQATLVKNKTTVLYIFTMTLFVFFYTGFIMGVIALLLIFVLSFTTKNFFTHRIDQQQTLINRSKTMVIAWIDQYFAAFREISKNWPKLLQSTWKNDIYQPYYLANQSQTIFYLYRDLLSQILVELPFLVNTSVVILGVYYEYISLAQLFVWVGFSQFMINASNAYLENRVILKQHNSLLIKINDILTAFQSRADSQTQPVISTQHAAHVILRDGSTIHLSLKPGIYPIRGENGAGKSTLLNVLMDFEKEHIHFENNHLSALHRSINQHNIRVIEKDVVVFECMSDINRQICGPAYNSTYAWHEPVTTATLYLLGPDLSDQWSVIFHEFAAQYHQRKDKTLSSGEKVILSFLRFLASWHHDVQLLIIDECDSFLDPKKKSLFIQAMHAASKHMAIYLCSHDNSLVDSMVLV